MSRPRISTISHKIDTIDLRQGSSAATERIRGGRLRKIRERIALRDGYTCVDCGRVTVDGEVDHEVPLHLGGAESDENRRWRCKECHALKSEREAKDRGH